MSKRIRVLLGLIVVVFLIAIYPVYKVIGAKSIASDIERSSTIEEETAAINRLHDWKAVFGFTYGVETKGSIEQGNAVVDITLRYKKWEIAKANHKILSKENYYYLFGE